MCFRKPAYRSSVDGRHCDLKKLTKTNFTLSLKPGIALTSASEYAAVHRLVGPYIQEGVEATVPPATRQVVEVVTERPGHDGASLAEELGLEKSSVQRRARAAATAGYIKNLEYRSRQPAHYVLGDPLRDEITILPSPEEL